MSTTTTAAAPERLQAILGRRVWDIDLQPALSSLAGERILVTGAAGSIGSAVIAELLQAPETLVYATDQHDADVTSLADVREAVDAFQPTLIFHLAAAKHAPWSEENPSQATAVNVFGTQNVITAANVANARVITASTCKACNPETVYGATKLIAERMTLEAGGSVVRFYNTVETCGNVFRLWEELPEDAPLPVTPCGRYFIALSEAVALMLHAAVQPPGRYIVHPGRRPRVMTLAARAAHPDRMLQIVPQRRGDRLSEPLCGSGERMVPVGLARDGGEWLWRVNNSHDAAARP